MDEILLADFMVFQDVVTSREYDLVIGDEAWDVDYYLHENPELKRFAYCWFTDFVGWLPMPDGGAHEQFVSADYNAEMIEHIARFPRVRDLAMFVGEPDDIVPDAFGPDLPLHPRLDRGALSIPRLHHRLRSRRARGPGASTRDAGLPARPNRCASSRSAGRASAPPVAARHRRVPDRRRARPRATHDRGRRTAHRPERCEPRRCGDTRLRSGAAQALAACDVAVVQGGLTTSMELTATARPFLYSPLRHHFEQNFHVPHRLDRYRAGRHMDYATATPDSIAAAIAEEIGRETDYRAVSNDGAERAAVLISDLL